MAITNTDQRFDPPVGAPIKGLEAPVTIMAATLQTAAYQATDVLDVRRCRRVTILIDGDAAAATSAISIIPLLSFDAGTWSDGAEQPPSATADVWFIPGVTDGAVTPSDPAGTLISGGDFTLIPEFGRVTYRPIEIMTEAFENATDELRLCLTIDVGDARWLHLQLADGSGAGTLATVLVKAVRSI